MRKIHITYYYAHELLQDGLGDEKQKIENDPTKGSKKKAYYFKESLIVKIEHIDILQFVTEVS